MPRLWTALVLLLAPSAEAADAPPAQWIVVTAPAFRDAVEPLCVHRKTEGLRVVVVQTTDVLSDAEVRAGEAGKLREHVNKLCRDHQGTSYVLLVGAVEAGKLDDAGKKVVPALAGSAGRMKGQPSDNGYGCLGDDRLPAVAVGRFPARTEDEARAIVRKTLDAERDRLPGTWRRRLTVLAGAPSFNPLVDKLVEGLAMARFDRIDPTWTGRVIYHNVHSHFCVPDPMLQKQALQYIQEGQAFTLYLGHSNPEGFYGGASHFLDRGDWAQLRIARGPGVFVTFGCNGCQLRGSDGEGYGVAAVRNPGGPVAVLGSHGICFGAMVQLAAVGLFESTFTGQVPERLGAAWLALKAGLAKGKIDDVTYKMLDKVDGDAKIPQATQRQEHLEMFVLLGDPALRLPAVAADIELQTDDKVSAANPLTVRGTVPTRLAGAKVQLTLERTAGSAPAELERPPKEPGPLGKVKDRVMLANHERANRFVLATAECEVRDGRFEAKLEVPAKLPWKRVLLRTYAATEKEESLAVLILPVRAKP
jgi:hypothetical protein